MAFANIVYAIESYNPADVGPAQDEHGNDTGKVAARYNFEDNDAEHWVNTLDEVIALLKKDEEAPQ